MTKCAARVPRVAERSAAAPVPVDREDEPSQSRSHPGRLDWMGTTLLAARSRRCRTSRMRNSASSPRPSSIARTAAVTISASVVSNGGVPATKGREPASLGARVGAPLDAAAEIRPSTRVRVPSTPPTHGNYRIKRLLPVPSTLRPLPTPSSCASGEISTSDDASPNSPAVASRAQRGARLPWTCASRRSA
jgi:hypothetical protein